MMDRLMTHCRAISTRKRNNNNNSSSAQMVDCICSSGLVRDDWAVISLPAQRPLIVLSLSLSLSYANRSGERRTKRHLEPAELFTVGIAGDAHRYR